MIVRLLSAVWLVATLMSLGLGIKLVVAGSGPAAASQLTAFIDQTSRIGKWQFRPALLLAAAAMQSFLAGNLNTSLWPWSTVAWVALFLQLLFLRPHLGGYVDIVRRGFERPVGPFTLVHVVLDIAIALALAALVVNGVQ